MFGRVWNLEVLYLYCLSMALIVSNHQLVNNVWYVSTDGFIIHNSMVFKELSSLITSSQFGVHFVVKALKVIVK